MLSFAVVDNLDWPIVAIWIVGRVTPVDAASVNAVVVDVDEDPNADDKLRSLTQGRVTVLTNGSTAGPLPMVGRMLVLSDLASLAVATSVQQERILEAVRAFAARPDAKTGRLPKTPRKIVVPEFNAIPIAADFPPRADTPPCRALAAANYLAALWSLWLQTEDERRRRASTANGDPWMMPDGLADRQIAELPSEFAEALTILDLV